MKIKYEKEVEGCWECDLWALPSDCTYVFQCLVDGREGKGCGDDTEYPCQMRPCPIAEAESEPAPKLQIDFDLIDKQ